MNLPKDVLLLALANSADPVQFVYEKSALEAQDQLASEKYALFVI